MDGPARRFARARFKSKIAGITSCATGGPTHPITAKQFMKYDLVLSPGAMRLALAAMVVASHYLPAAGIPVAFLFDAVPVYGFFFLSGYWVARLWDEKYSHCRRPLFTFYLSRAWRIYPLATASTLLTFCVVGADWWTLLDNIFLISPTGVAGAGPINAPLWSLAIELQFYAIAPILFLIRKNTLAIGAILITGFAFWLEFAAGVPRLFVIHFIFLFALGVRFSVKPWADLARRVAPYSLIATLVISIAANLPALLSMMVADGIVRFVYIGIALLGLPYVAASLAKRSNKRDRWLGDLSFPLYVFHSPAMLIAALWGGAAVVPLAIVLCVALTIAANVIIDRPIEGLRNRFIGRRLLTPEPEARPDPLALARTMPPSSREA
jgi:peptidoglycan/LPS O-acetylase OafA/YrhL